MLSSTFWGVTCVWTLEGAARVERVYVVGCVSGLSGCLGHTSCIGFWPGGKPTMVVVAVQEGSIDHDLCAALEEGIK